MLGKTLVPELKGRGDCPNSEAVTAQFLRNQHNDTSLSDIGVLPQCVPTLALDEGRVSCLLSASTSLAILPLGLWSRFPSPDTFYREKDI